MNTETAFHLHATHSDNYRFPNILAPGVILQARTNVCNYYSRVHNYLPLQAGTRYLTNSMFQKYPPCTYDNSVDENILCFKGLETKLNRTIHTCLI